MTDKPISRFYIEYNSGEIFIDYQQNDIGSLLMIKYVGRDSEDFFEYMKEMIDRYATKTRTRDGR